MSFAGVSLIVDGELCASTKPAIDAGAASGYHLLVVEGYSRTKDIPTGWSMRSRPFLVGGHRWMIAYYPNGDMEESAEFISVCLFLMDNDLEQPVKAQLTFSFIDQTYEQASTSIRPRDVFDFHIAHNSFGPSKFMKREVLERSTHLKGDSFIIRCDIIVKEGVNTDSGTGTTTHQLIDVPPSDLQSHFSDLLLSKQGADLTVEVGGETFAAHRCVLAARSSVFKAELFGDIPEGATTPSTLKISDIEPKVFGALLTFIYTDSLSWMEIDYMEQDEAETASGAEISVEWLLQLLEAADRCDLQRLKLICEEDLANLIGVSTVLDIVAVAERRRCRWLKEACSEFIKSHTGLRKVLTADGLEQITKTCPSVLKELLSKFAS